MYYKKNRGKDKKKGGPEEEHCQAMGLSGPLDCVTVGQTLGDGTYGEL